MIIVLWRFPKSWGPSWGYPLYRWMVDFMIFHGKSIYKWMMPRGTPVLGTPICAFSINNMCRKGYSNWTSDFEDHDIAPSELAIFTSSHGELWSSASFVLYILMANSEKHVAKLVSWFITAITYANNYMSDGGYKPTFTQLEGPIL